MKWNEVQGTGALYNGEPKETCCCCCCCRDKTVRQSTRVCVQLKNKSCVYLITVNALERSIELVLGDILDDLGDLALVIDEEKTLEDVLDLLDRDRVDKGSVEDLRDGGGKSLHCCFCE